MSKRSMGKRTSTRGSRNARPIAAQTRSKSAAEMAGTGSGAAAARERSGPSPEERQQWIAVAAYYHAEHRGFTPGSELDDWLEAEAEIEQEPRTT